MGRGYQLIAAYDRPALGAVYKIVAIEDENGSAQYHQAVNNAEKVSTPGKKQVWRITSREKGKSEGDYITYEGLMSMAWKSWEILPTLYTIRQLRI